MDHPTADNPYAPPSVRPTRPGRLHSTWAVMYAQAIATGLILGLIDIHMNNKTFLLIRLAIYCAVAGFQGWRYGAVAVGSVLILGSSLAPIHMVAIACGYRKPYVEEDQASAAMLVVLNIPCFLAFAAGRAIRLIQPSRFERGSRGGKIDPA